MTTLKWLGILLALGLAGAIAYVLWPSKRKCPTGETPNGPCGPQCIDYNCPVGMHYDCKKGCICDDGQKPCGDQCGCSVCVNDLCCPAGDQCKDDTGKPHCCGGNRTCDHASNTCTSLCGAQTCADDEFCLTVGPNASPQVIASFQKAYPKGLCSTDPKTKTQYCKVCAPKNTGCNLSASATAPTVVPVGSDNFYPCTMNLDHVDSPTSNRLGICASPNASAKPNAAVAKENVACAANDGQAACGAAKCQWLDGLTAETDILAQVLSDVQTQGGSNPLLGNWCEAHTGEAYNRIESKVSATPGCLLSDCFNTFASSANLQDINWDPATNRCSAVLGCSPGSPPMFAQTCTDPPQSSQYTFDGQGDISAVVQSTCAGLTACNTAVNSGKGTGWCVVSHADGTATQGCQPSYQACQATAAGGDPFSFIQNAAECPAGEPGACSLDNYLMGAGPSRKCTAPDLSNTRGATCTKTTHCDSGSTSPSVMSVLENRTTSLYLSLVWHSKSGYFCSEARDSALGTWPADNHPPDNFVLGPGESVYAMGGIYSSSISDPDLSIDVFVCDNKTCKSPGTSPFIIHLHPEGSDSQFGQCKTPNCLFPTPSSYMPAKLTQSADPRVRAAMAIYYSWFEPGFAADTCQGTRVVFYEPWQVPKGQDVFTGNSITTGGRTTACNPAK